MRHKVTGPFASTGREVYIAEAVRTPIGKSHPERGWYRDIHPNAMLAACYSELVRRTEIRPSRCARWWCLFLAMAGRGMGVVHVGYQNACERFA